MALRDQPYLPLYVQDFLTDEKLMECSAATTGVYIRLICIMHKSENYGCILLKQKFKQTDKQIKNFALQLAKFLPYTDQIIFDALTELLDEKVLLIDGDFLTQKRMVKDNKISLERSKAGKKGGKTTQKNIPKDKYFAKANNEANYESEYVNESGIDNKEVDKEHLNICLHILAKFKFNEIRNPDKLRKISEFVNRLKFDKKFEWFAEQYKSYWLYKDQSGQEKQSLETFIDGGWDRQNWTEKLKESNNGKQSTAEQRQRERDALDKAAGDVLGVFGINLDFGSNP